MTKRRLCPCGSTAEFAHCCQPYLLGNAKPQSVEALMRSRFCAYVEQNWTYLLGSWHVSTRPAASEFTGQTALKWMDLQVLAVEQREDSGFVSFCARYKINGRMQVLREKSRFVLEAGRWYYVDGVVEESR